MRELSAMTTPNPPILDRHRPRYHFTAPANWINDPNGLIHWRGTYHLFYQYNPFGSLWGNMHWGHAISTDLVHWRHLPIALAPAPGGPDANGCFSGCAVDNGDHVLLMYTGVGVEGAQLPCIATSSDDLLQTWTKSDRNPVIAGPPPDLETIFFRDHTVWQEDDTWYQGNGSGIVGKGGAVLVYRSADLLSWEYMHPLAVGDERQTEPFRTGTGWECPDFFAIDGKHGLIVASHDNGGLNVAWMTGRYEDSTLSPSRLGLVDAGPSFYAPQSFFDANGRRLMFGWLRERRSDDEQVHAGWSGTMTLPRILHIDPDGLLITAPAPETAALRTSHHNIDLSTIAPDGTVPGIHGMALEIEATFLPGTEIAGLIVPRSVDGQEETRIFFDPAAGTLTLDTTGSSANPEVVGTLTEAPVAFNHDGPITLRAYLDHSVIEVFLNDRMAISDRLYPVNDDAGGVAIVNASQLQSLHIWTMAAILP